MGGLGTGTITIGSPYWSQCFSFESPMSCFKRICDVDLPATGCGYQTDCDLPCHKCCPDEISKCPVSCCCRPYKDSDTMCFQCDSCILGGGGGNTFTYIPPIGVGVSGPPGNLYNYRTPENSNIQPSVKEVYPFIPGTLIPWCPGECQAGNSTVFIECPRKCNSWKFGLPCDDEIEVQLEGWNLTDLFSSNLVGGVLSYYNTESDWVDINRYLTEPNLNNKDIGSNPIRSLGPKGWFVANTRGMGSSLNLKEVANIDYQINPIKLEWQVPDSDPDLPGDSEPGDYLQVAVGSKYGTIIHSNASYPLINKIAINTFDGATGLNEPDYSSLFFWPIPNHNNQIVNDDGLLRNDKKIRISARNHKSPYSTNEFNVPYYISSASTAAGDVFGTVWSNTHWNPYRSFGMNLYYLKNDSSSELNGITWQLNGGGTAQNQAYGIRPDLILWKFAHQLYPGAFTIGHTGCEGFTYTNQHCNGREWFGFMGQTLMEACDSNQIPTSLYYKQISLSNDFALVTLAHYEPEYDQESLKINDLQIHDVGRQVWKNRREQARWLFMISTINDYRTMPLEPMDTVEEHFILDPVNNEVPTRLLTFNGKDNIYHYGLIDDNGNHIKIPDHDNDVCRFCTPPGGNEENNYIMNWMICGIAAAGFTSCFKEEIEFGASNHPIWNTKTNDRPDMPYVYVLDALAHAKTFNSNAVSASWDWIDATTLNAVLSWTDSTLNITKKFVKLYEGDLLATHPCPNVNATTPGVITPSKGPWCPGPFGTIVTIKGKNLNFVTGVSFGNKSGTVLGVTSANDWSNPTLQILTVRTPAQFDEADRDTPVDIKLVHPPCEDYYIENAYTPRSLSGFVIHGATFSSEAYGNNPEYMCEAPPDHVTQQGGWPNHFGLLTIIGSGPPGTNFSGRGIDRVSLRKPNADPIIASQVYIDSEGPWYGTQIRAVFNTPVKAGQWTVHVGTPCENEELTYKMSTSIPMCNEIGSNGIVCHDINEQIPVYLCDHHESGCADGNRFYRVNMWTGYHGSGYTGSPPQPDPARGFSSTLYFWRWPASPHYLNLNHSKNPAGYCQTCKHTIAVLKHAAAPPGEQGYTNLAPGTLIGPTSDGYWCEGEGSEFGGCDGYKTAIMAMNGAGGAVGAGLWEPNKTGYIGYKFNHRILCQGYCPDMCTAENPCHYGYIKMQIGATMGDRKVIKCCFNPLADAPITIQE